MEASLVITNPTDRFMLVFTGTLRPGLLAETR